MGEIAALVSAAHVSLEEYLSTSYRPDVEFIDGILKEKPAVSPAHGRTQMMLGWWFGIHEAEWAIQVFAESRTQVSVTKVRLPDASVLPAGPVPRKVITQAALIAIEVLSESDTYRELKERDRDFESMGVRNIWLLDPAAQTAEVWTKGDWRSFDGVRLQAIEPPIYLDLAWLWKQVGPEE